MDEPLRAVAWLLSCLLKSPATAFTTPRDTTRNENCFLFMRVWEISCSSWRFRETVAHSEILREISQEFEIIPWNRVVQLVKKFVALCRTCLLRRVRHNRLCQMNPMKTTVSCSIGTCLVHPSNSCGRRDRRPRAVQGPAFCLEPPLHQCR